MYTYIRKTLGTKKFFYNFFSSIFAVSKNKEKMGYLVKISEDDNDIVKMFYSKPDYGCYSCDTMYVSIKEYDEYYSKEDNDDWVFMSGWRDASESSKYVCGIIITDSFIIDSILQGEKLEYNSPLEFGLIK